MEWYSDMLGILACNICEVADYGSECPRHSSDIVLV